MKDPVYLLIGIIFTGLSVNALITGYTWEHTWDDTPVIPATFDSDPLGFYLYVLLYGFLGIACLHEYFFGE